MNESQNEQGPVPRDAERSVLGGILLDNAALAGIADLSAADFAGAPERLVYEAMLSLWNDGRPIDRVTLKDELCSRGTYKQVGGEDYIDLLDTVVPSASNVGYYARIVREAAVSRRMRKQTAAVLERTALSPEDMGEALRRIADGSGGVNGRSEDAARRALSTYARPMAELYGLADLELDRNRRLVSIATLPRWPGHGWDDGHGLGWRLNRVLGGGLCPGYMLGIGAASAKAGKTACVMQLAEGLGLRSAEIAADDRRMDEPLTPVLVLSEMSAKALTWRSLARWCGHPSSVYRAGRSAAEAFGRDASTDAAFADAAAALAEGTIYALARRHFLRSLTFAAGHAGLPTSGANLVRGLSPILALWRADLEREHRREVWPVLVVDPIQRWQGRDSGGEVESLNELVEVLREEVEREGWIVLLTSDTNATSGRGGGTATTEPKTPQQKAAAVFRGSYKLLHTVDAALCLVHASEGETDEWQGAGDKCVDAVLAVNRWGAAAPATTDPKWPRFRWHPPTGRFGALTEAQAMAQASVRHTNGEPARADARSRAAGAFIGTGE